MRKWRKMTWTIWVTNVIFLIWLIAAVASRPSKNCHAGQYLSRHDCIAASDTGTAIGVGLVLFLWFLVFVVESLVWFMTRPRHSESPSHPSGA